jgi:hypothetical protein
MKRLTPAGYISYEGQPKSSTSNAKEIHFLIRLFKSACLNRSSSLRGHMFDRDCATVGVLPFRRTRQDFPKNADVRRARVVSTGYRGSLLASPHLAKRAPGSKAFARCGDVSGAVSVTAPLAVTRGDTMLEPSKLSGIAGTLRRHLPIARSAATPLKCTVAASSVL